MYVYVAILMSSLLVIVSLVGLAVLPLDEQTARWLGALLGLVPSLVFGWYASKDMDVRAPNLDVDDDPPQQPVRRAIVKLKDYDRIIGDD